MDEKSKILVVDDDEVVRRSHLRSLAGANCEVKAVWDGTEALRAFWEGVAHLTEVRAPSQTPIHTDFASVTGPAELPSTAPTLLLFAGKGGVG